MQCCPILAEQINRTEPRYPAKRHHMFDITARPRPLPVTESFALPPRPRAVNMSHVNKFSIREARPPDIAADLSCAVSRRRDAYSMVIHLGASPLPAQAKVRFPRSNDPWHRWLTN